MLPWDKDVCGRSWKLFMGILNYYKFRIGYEWGPLQWDQERNRAVFLATVLFLTFPGYIYER